MIKKIPFLCLLIIALASCESTSIEDEISNTENNDPEIMDVFVDDNHGLGN